MTWLIYARKIVRASQSRDSDVITESLVEMRHPDEENKNRLTLQADTLHPATSRLYVGSLCMPSVSGLGPRSVLLPWLGQGQRHGFKRVVGNSGTADSTPYVRRA